MGGARSRRGWTDAALVAGVAGVAGAASALARVTPGTAPSSFNAASRSVMPSFFATN